MCSTAVTYANTSSDHADTVDVSVVRLAFVVCGSTFALPTLLFLVAGVRALTLKRRQLLAPEGKLNGPPSSPERDSNGLELNGVATVSGTVDNVQHLEASTCTKSSSSETDTTSDNVNTTAKNDKKKAMDDAKQSRFRYR
jgi:hypothetical protein